MHQFATITLSNPDSGLVVFKQIMYWAKGVILQNTIVVKLVETTGRRFSERPTLLPISAVVHVVLLSGVERGGIVVNVFGQGESGTNVTLDLDMIGKVVFEINKQQKMQKTPDWTTVLLDDLCALDDSTIPMRFVSVDGRW
jgi:hypothetical protein